MEVIFRLLKKLKEGNLHELCVTRSQTINFSSDQPLLWEKIEIGVVTPYTGQVIILKSEHPFSSIFAVIKKGFVVKIVMYITLVRIPGD